MKKKNISDTMTCVEKRHISHRVGSMLHHRFPNGFTDMFMDETDREVSTLTDRAFRSLCIGDDAVYNDEFSYGFSPFSCHKPLAGEPHKKTVKDTKKQSWNDKHESQPWKHQQQKTMSQMSSFLKALSATEESYGGVFKKNGVTDSNGESWDKSALRSIQKELSEFSADYHTNLSEGYKNHQQHSSGDASTNKKGKDKSLSSGKSSKNKHVKTNVKLKKLNIKNFFLHSEFSPFQAWTDSNRFCFAQESIVTSILPEDPVPKWFDLPFYKELSEAPKKETPQAEEPESCQTAPTEPPPPPPPAAEPKPIPPPVPPKVLPKPVITAAAKRCTSEGGDGTAAPWRRNRSRATSAVPINQAGIQTQDIAKQVDENLLLLKKVDENLLLLKKAEENLTSYKKEARSVEVKTVEEVNSLASTPFSICQLMTPIIPSRQPTDTSEILTVLSPSALDLPLRPQSEAKVTPEPPLKRDSYKSLASSILFNLKDNRKRMKSRYSPRKFKTLEETESGSSLSDHVKQAFSEGLASGMNTPAIVKDVEIVCSPLSEISVQSVDLAKHDAERPLSNDYLLSHLLQSKAEVEASPLSPLLQMKKNKSPLAKKQNYPSLNLYKKASPVDSDMKSLHIPLSPDASVHTENVNNYLSPPLLSPLLSPKSSGLSPNKVNVNKDLSPAIPSPVVQKEDLSLQEKVVKRPPDVPEKPKRNNSIEPVTLKENNAINQTVNTSNVVKAAREAINAAKHKALSTSDSFNKPIDEINEVQNKEKQSQMSQDILDISENAETIPAVNNNTEAISADKKKEPPPVPKRNFTKSDIQLSIDNTERLTNGDLDNGKVDVKSKNKKEAAQKQGKLKHIFSARQNNYIKNQRYARADDEREVECEESDKKASVKADIYESEVSREIRDSENIISDLNALKELERARLADRIYDSAKNKFEVVDIVEQTKARNDLISRELRNIKKGMLSMRGNTTAKREVFAKKEKEQSKGDVFTKLDSNVLVNKALINDNYDRAKMALEEIISERERRKNVTEQEESEQEAGGDDIRNYKAVNESEEKPNGLSASELKERLGDLRDHNHMRHILSQSEPRPGETHRAGSKIALPGMDRMSEELSAIVKAKSEKIEKLICNYLSGDSTIQAVDSSLASEETIENKDKMQDAPPVPPRSRKGSIRRDSVGQDIELSIKHVIGDVQNKSKDEKEELCLTDKLNDICSTTLKGYDTEPKTDFESAKTMHSKCTSLPNETLLTPIAKNPKLYLSPETTPAENKKEVSPTSEIISERKIQPIGTGKVKRRAPLRPDYLNPPASKDSNNAVLDQSEKTISTNEDSKIEAENPVESPRNIISPLLLVNGVSVCQSPPDQASLSSKSSYFSAESTLHRNTETESNVYHSLENLIGEVEEVEEEESVSMKTRHNSDRTEAEYYSFSDHENEPELLKIQINSPLKDPVVLSKEAGNKSINENHVTEDEVSSNPVSPTFAIPALFKVKDNTFSKKMKKTTQLWSPRGSLAGLEHVLIDHKIPEPQENPEERLISNTTISSHNTEPEQVLPSPPQLILPTSPPSEILTVQQDDCFLRVPEQDRYSGVSPLSEGVDSTAASTVETADEAGVASGIECEVSKVPSERSGSTCSGNDSQPGLPKPPTVLPKSEKAVLKAIKLTNRRIKKEEAQKSSHKSSHSSSKHKSDRHKSEKSEHKNSTRNSKSGERKHKEKTQSAHQNVEERATQSQNPTDTTDQATRRQSVESAESSNHGAAVVSERQGRDSERQVRDKPEHRHYSSDRVFSNVPVYKTTVEDKTRSDRRFQRSLSTDRYTENRVERRLSADMSMHDRLDSRSQRIEKSLMDEFQQRGRQKVKPSKESPLRRSQSIDSQNTNVLHPPNLSRQSSLSSQFSRQSSMEHAVIAQSFPMTQRKLLQDPDSGHYFFVDMPVQVKTKTFYDPETGTYVQLPVQPSEGAVPQPSPMEVLSPPLMVYHSFVPVSLSPMAQAAPAQPPHMEHEERVMRHTDAHTYLEPVFGQHEHMLGEFLGTEELDCPS